MTPCALPLSWDSCTTRSWPGHLPGCAPEHAQIPPPSASGSNGHSPVPSVKHQCILVYTCSNQNFDLGY